MTPQEAINIAREFSKANKEVLPLTTEAIDTLISELEKQPQYPSEEEMVDVIDCIWHSDELATRQKIHSAMEWMLSEWKESNNKNK